MNARCGLRHTFAIASSREPLENQLTLDAGCLHPGRRRACEPVGRAGLHMKARMRYSLRIAILCVTFIAVAMVLWANGASHQRRTVAEIYALGGSVDYEYGFLHFLEPALGVHFVADVSVVYLYHYDPATVDPGYAGFVTNTDALIPHLQRLPNLQRVVGMFNHGDEAGRLRRALPGVEIEIGLGGII